MSEPSQTLDGWFCLHDLRKIDWASWKNVPNEEKQSMIQAFLTMVESWQKIEEEENGSFALYTVIGHKADIIMMNLRPSMHDLDKLENEFNKLRISDYMIQTYSYVSVVEQGNYTPPKDGSDPLENPNMRARVYPILPKWDHICFYPMDKKRDGDDNWYSLPLEKRVELMKAHGMTGRKYAGEIKQIISGSTGLDDWEWAVTLFAHDALQFKKLIYEMRFDEVSARYGEFGSFYVGNILNAEKINAYLHV